jgi:hypothetical protein
MAGRRTGAGENVSAALWAIFGTADRLLSGSWIVPAGDSTSVRVAERVDFASIMMLSDFVASESY